MPINPQSTTPTDRQSYGTPKQVVSGLSTHPGDPGLGGVGLGSLQEAS